MTSDFRTALLSEKAKLEAELSAINQLLGSKSVAASEPVVARRERLTQESIEDALAQVIELLKKHPNGLRSEQIRADLNMNKKLFQYAAHLGKTSDQLAQTGERRSTVYALPARPSKAQEEGRVIRKKKR
jgi:hypothetical protein